MFYTKKFRKAGVSGNPYLFSGTQTETYIQLAIPYLPMWLAAICLVLNVLVPGTGEILYLSKEFIYLEVFETKSLFD